jgi:ribosomal protein S18 acetylase RimI-like enzyme
MNIVIRDYREADWPAICRVHDRARPDELLGSYDARAFIPLAQDSEAESIKACDMFVAQLGDEVVGFAGIDAPYLAWLYVDPAHYRRGIGRSLLRHCLSRMGADAWTRACGNNEAALRLYLSEGFVIESRFTGNNAGYEGPAARLALHPERQGWTKPKRSQSSGAARERGPSVPRAPGKSRALPAQ